MRKTLLICSAVFVAGCAQTQPAKLPSVDLSLQWRAASTGEPGSVAWWKAFGDTTLNELEKQALGGNLDIQQAQARVDQARSAAGLAKVALAPSVNLDASAGRVQQSLNSGLGVLSNYVPNYSRMVDPGQLALSATWDLDFAGGLKSQREAAGANLEARAAEMEALRLTISAEVADAYFSMLGSRLQKAALAWQIELLTAQTRTMEARVRVGGAAQVDLDRIQSAVAETSAPIAALTANISIQKNRLALLLGQNPSSWDVAIESNPQLPVAADPAGGVPADVLRRRPDVVAAERRAASAGAGVAVSMAEYYPRISLSAALGQDSSNYANLDSSRSTFAQSFLGVRWRLFDFGRIDAEVKVAKGKQQEALIAYRATVLRAASEVESGFSQLAAARERLKHLEEQAGHARQISKAIQNAFKAGSASEDEVRGADRNVAKAEFDIAAGQLDVSLSIAQVARALGGPVEVQ